MDTFFPFSKSVVARVVNCQSESAVVSPKIDNLFEEKAYVSVVPFTMKKIRQRNTPPFPPIYNFNKENIRTYIRYDGKTGLHFLSL